MRFAASLCCCLLLVACGGGGGSSASISVSPKSLPYTGGSTTVFAYLSGDNPTIVRTGPDGSESLAMTAMSDGGYSVEVTIPANTADTGEAASHQFDLRVTGDDGEEDLLASTTLSVAAMEAPPRPPDFSE